MSEEWLALPDGPAKVAAVVRAAECWATDLEATLERLRAEQESASLAVKLTEDAEYVEQRDEHRREWSRKSWRPHPVNRTSGVRHERDKEPEQDGHDHQEAAHVQVSDREEPETDDEHGEADQVARASGSRVSCHAVSVSVRGLVGAR